MHRVGIEQWRRLVSAKQTLVEPIVLYEDGAVSSLCHGDDATRATCPELVV